MRFKQTRQTAVDWLKKYRVWLGLGAAALVLAYVSVGLSVSLSDFQMRRAGAQWTNLDMPLARPSGEPGTFEVRGTLSFGLWSSRELHITPDDEVQAIRINDRNVDLSDIPPEKRRDYQNGFGLNVGQYVETGDNTIEIIFADYGGNIGMAIETGYGGWRSVTLALLWLALAVIAALYAHRTSNIPRHHMLLYLIVLIGAALQVWVICTYNPMDHIWSDPQRHWEQGTEPLRNDMMSNTDPVMYQIYVGALAKLSLGMPGLVAFYTCLLALLTPWLWYRFLRELQGSKTAALAGWAVLSLLPSWMSIYSYFMQETLMLPMLGAALWATWRARRKQTLNAFLIMVLLWALAGLTRGLCIPLAAVAVTWLWLAQPGKGPKAVYSVVLLGLILGPLTYRSYETVGIFAPHGVGQMNMIYAQSGKKKIDIGVRRDGAYWRYGFQSPAVGAKPLAPLSDWQSQREGSVRVDININRGARDWEQALEKTSMDLRKYLWITGDNLLLLFFSESWPDSNRNTIPGYANYISRWMWAPLGLACLIAFAVSRRLRRRDLLLPSLILTWFVVQGLLPLAVNEGRYRKPFEGLIIAQAVLMLGAPRTVHSAGGARPTSTGGSPPVGGAARLGAGPSTRRRRERYRRNRRERHSITVDEALR